jgi:hypothetical protein
MFTKYPSPEPYRYMTFLPAMTAAVVPGLWLKIRSRSSAVYPMNLPGLQAGVSVTP